MTVDFDSSLDQEKRSPSSGEKLVRALGLDPEETKRGSLSFQPFGDMVLVEWAGMRVLTVGEAAVLFAEVIHDDEF